MKKPMPLPVLSFYDCYDYLLEKYNVESLSYTFVEERHSEITTFQYVDVNPKRLKRYSKADRKTLELFIENFGDYIQDDCFIFVFA